MGLCADLQSLRAEFYLKGFAMPPTPFLGSGASFQGPGPLPMAWGGGKKGRKGVEMVTESAVR